MKSWLLLLSGLALALVLTGCPATRLPLSAQMLPIYPDLSLGVPSLGSNWVMTREVPESLVAETARHLQHELEAQGKEFAAEAVLEQARKRLAANELFIYNPRTGATLTVDFSPLRADEGPPGRSAIANSAAYAAQGLEEEDGLSAVTHKTARTSMFGLQYAYRIDANFQKHGAATRFLGVVGFASPYWCYFYYTDPLQDPQDYTDMVALLQGMVVHAGVGK
jgi:hypothetical protein